MTVLKIGNVSKINYGNYTCSITVNTNRGPMNRMSKNSMCLLDDLKSSVKGMLTTNVVEGADQVTIPCDYSETEGNVDTVIWNEVDDSGKDIDIAVIDSIKKVNGRYKLMIATPGIAYLIIDSPTREDSGKLFKCIVFFADKTAAILDPPSLVNVWYLDKPAITIPTSSVYEGTSFTLTCSNINGNSPTPIQVTWLKDNIIINNDSSRYEIYEDFNRIRIPVASVNDSGNYQCRVENEVNGEEKTSLNLNISVIKFHLNKPNVTASQSVIYEGNSFTLICNNINPNPPTPIQVTWFKDNIIIITNDSSRYEIYKDLNRIRIPFASVDDSGNYQCRVESDAHREGNTSLGLSISVITLCVPNLQYKISTMILICTTFTAIILGSLPTCLMCHYIRKRKERKIHLQYQNSQYKALNFRPTSAVYKELNKVNDEASSTVKNDTNSPSVEDKICAKVDVIYEDVKE
ncbi:hemicentin-1-like [Anneissia japonica]|uniref:hemicentin-1-like n=1 Tax=Anneissia japonica TaxID=1529436 RepID=UPI00142559F4|nr:hemicentin-1-like [Anneissia japonica]